MSVALSSYPEELTSGELMIVQDYSPSSLLQPWIQAYKIIESDGELINRVLPGTSAAVAFCMRGSNFYATNGNAMTLPYAAISGLRKSARLIGYAKGTCTLIALLKEGGATAFFREPLHNLFEQSISLDDLIPASDVRRVEEQLFEARNNPDAIAIVEQFFMERMQIPPVDKMVEAALREIKASRGLVRIKELEDRLCVSADTFEKRFRRIVGASPKQFSSIVRLTSIIREQASRERMIDFAFDAGYYDHSHFIKSFKRFTGQTPGDFFASGQYW